MQQNRRTGNVNHRLGRANSNFVAPNEEFEIELKLNRRKQHLPVSSGKCIRGDVQEVVPVLPGHLGLCCTAAANWSATVIDVLIRESN